MSLASARNGLADALRPALPGYNIFPAPQSLDTITKPTLALIRTNVEKAPEAPLGFHMNTLSLWVICPITLANKSEDALDDLLEEVLEALDEVAVTRWSTAERSVWGDANPAYNISLQTLSNRKA